MCVYMWMCVYMYIYIFFPLSIFFIDSSIGGLLVGFLPWLLKKNFFFMWNIFKVFIESDTIFFLFYVLFFWPQGMWDYLPDQELNPHLLQWNCGF